MVVALITVWSWQPWFAQSSILTETECYERFLVTGTIDKNCPDSSTDAAIIKGYEAQLSR